MPEAGERVTQHECHDTKAFASVVSWLEQCEDLARGLRPLGCPLYPVAMHWRLATVVVATAVIAAGCGGGTDDTGGSPTATPTAEAGRLHHDRCSPDDGGHKRPGGR